MRHACGRPITGPITMTRAKHFELYTTEPLRHFRARTNARKGSKPCVFTTTLCTIVAIAALAALTLDAVGCGADSSPSQRQPVAPSPTGSPMTASPSATPTPPGSADSINVLYSFDGTHGADPKGSLVLGELAGKPTLFGRTAFGGPGSTPSDPASAPGGGVIFSLPTSGGALSGEFDFPGGDDGYQPHHDAMVLLGSTLWGAACFPGRSAKADRATARYIRSTRPTSLRPTPRRISSPALRMTAPIRTAPSASAPTA